MTKKFHDIRQEGRVGKAALQVHRYLSEEPQSAEGVVVEVVVLLPAREGKGKHIDAIPVRSAVVTGKLFVTVVFARRPRMPVYHGLHMLELNDDVVVSSIFAT